MTGSVGCESGLGGDGGPDNLSVDSLRGEGVIGDRRSVEVEHRKRGSKEKTSSFWTNLWLENKVTVFGSHDELNTV